MACLYRSKSHHADGRSLCILLKAGESLQWKDADGKFYSYGIILELEPDKLLKHSLYDMKTKSRITSYITYRFEDMGKYTILHAEEELTFDMRDDQFEEALEGWDLALDTVKEIAERKENNIKLPFIHFSQPINSFTLVILSDPPLLCPINTIRNQIN